MKKTLTIVALIALLAVPFFAVSAEGEKWTICHATRSVAHPYSRIVVSDKAEGGHFDAQGNPLHGGDILLEGEQDCPADPEITSRVTCAGWRVFADGEKVEEGFWTLPFELEVAFSVVLDQRIREPEECLKERGDVTLRIGGRCTEDGDSQEIGYVFDDGDFDDARLIITRSDGVEVANVGEGSDFFPARATGYSWKVVWFNGQTREVVDSGEFEVNKCDLPEPTPTPPPGDCSNTGDNICPGDEPPEHPPTGGEMDAGLAVVTGLMGFALAGIGGSILFMKRRASR